MSAQISYMGTKRHLASTVAGICESLTKGPVLDAFAGMGAVAVSLAGRRNVWVNDCQVFASTVSKTLFKSKLAPPSLGVAKKFLEPDFERNKDALVRRFPKMIAKESKYLKTKSLDDVIKGNTSLPHVGSCRELEILRKRLARKPSTFPYRMATITYVGAYFGVEQCFDIDSIRFAIDKARERGAISAQGKAWFLVALCQVASKTNNSTGQFAQYIKPKSNNLGRILQKRRRSVWTEFLETLETLSPVGSELWRSDNLAFRSDTLDLLPRLRRTGRSPGVIYADPPYTNAEYSRYYHVLDMIIEYRYPPASGVGRYPDQRKQPEFARVTTVAEAMRRLIKQSALLNVPLVLSYPGTGILHKTGVTVEELLCEKFKNVKIAHSQFHKHSTFGGACAPSSVQANELVYTATHPLPA